MNDLMPPEAAQISLLDHCLTTQQKASAIASTIDAFIVQRYPQAVPERLCEPPCSELDYVGHLRYLCAAIPALLAQRRIVTAVETIGYLLGAAYEFGWYTAEEIGRMVATEDGDWA